MGRDRDGSVVKGTGTSCFSRGPEFSFQYPCCLAYHSL